MMHERYRTVGKVAHLLLVNDVTVRRWIKNGEPRAIDIGKGWQIGPGDLDTFREGHATIPAGKADCSTETAGTGAQEKKGQKN